MIHYHFLKFVKTHQHGRLYQHHLFRFTPKVEPNEKMAPPSRAKGGAMTPVALPPPPLRSPVPRTSTYRSGPYESRQEKTDLPKTKLCCQTGPSTTSNYRGMLYVTTGTGPNEAHQEGPPPKRNYCQSGPTTTSNNRSGPHLGCQDGPLPNRNCFRNGPTTLNYTGAGPCWSCQDESFQKEMPTKNVPTQQHSLPELARTYCKVLRVGKKFCKKVLRAAGGPS